MTSSAVTLGRTIEGIPAQFDIVDEKHLFVTGPDRSGKTAILRTMTQQLVNAGYIVEVISLDGTTDYGDIEGLEEIAEDRFAARRMLIETCKALKGDTANRVVIVDGFCELTESLEDAYEDEDEAGEFIVQGVRRILQHGAKSGVHAIVCSTSIPERLRQFKHAGAHLLLGQVSADEVRSIQEVAPEINPSLFGYGRGVISSSDRLVSYGIVAA